MYDPDRYRDKAEIAQWRTRDPIDVFSARLRASGALTDDDISRVDTKVIAAVDAAVAAAEAGPLEPVDHLTRFVYSEVAP
jgi:pyruvate dehydrogenase E1 component alpha subunit